MKTIAAIMIGLAIGAMYLSPAPIRISGDEVRTTSNRGWVSTETVGNRVYATLSDGTIDKSRYREGTRNFREISDGETTYVYWYDLSSGGNGLVVTSYLP